ncbi:MAG: hypothetical protein IT366_23445 [Candidatus Hydrogenedentes bacterium]|nr:hypothetical protein [Candidatus Hydrogenedentota bacterium]
MHLKRVVASAAFAFAAGLTAVSAWAQPPGGLPAPGGPGGPGGGRPGIAPIAQLSPEDAAKVTAAQVKYVASSLTLNEDQSKKVAEAYTAYRDGLRKRFEGGGISGDSLRTAMTEERGKLETALKGFLTPEQSATVAGLLSSSLRWDGMVIGLNSLGLEEAKYNEAMKAVANFLTESNKAREAGGDREAMRAKSQELREALTTELGKILTPEQLAKLQEAPGFRQRGPGGGGGGAGRRERNNQEAPAPAPTTPAAEGEKKN